MIISVHRLINSSPYFDEIRDNSVFFLEEIILLRLNFIFFVFCAVLCCTVCPSFLYAVSALAPDRVDKTGEISLARLEASIYSLPHVEAKVDFVHPTESVIPSPQCNPLLRFPWKVVDHSRALNVTSELTVRIFNDEAFPSGEETRWVEVETAKKRITNHETNQKTEARFERQGCVQIPLVLDYNRPVVRLKVVLNAAVRSSLHSSSDTKEQVIYVALPAKWKELPQSHGALTNMTLYLYRMKHTLLIWRTWLSSVMLANRSLRDSRRFGASDVVQVLEDSRKLVRYNPDDRELEDTSFNLIRETSRIKGKLSENIDPVSAQLLGVNRLSFSAIEAIDKFGSSLNEDLDKIVHFRNFFITVLNFDEAAEMRERISRVVHFVNDGLQAISFLFNMNNSQDLAIFLRRTSSAISQVRDELAGLVRLTGKLIGRDRSAYSGWSEIFETDIYKDLYPEAASGNKDVLCKAVRDLFQGYYYILVSAHFQARVCEAAFIKSLEPFNLDAMPAVITQPVDDKVIPKELFVVSSETGHSIEPGKIASYKISVRNLHNQPREVRFSEIRKLPSGWISKMTRDAITLQPGAEDEITYSVIAPYYARQTMTARSSVRVYFAEDTAHFHEIVYQTRCITGDGVESGKSTGPDSLFVTAPDSERTITPGGVASYTFIVKHLGPTRKLVNFDIVSKLPDNWIIDVEPRKLYMHPERPQKVTIKVTAPLYLKKEQTIELIAGVGYAEDFESLEKIDLTTLITHLKVEQSKPGINSGETKTYIIANHGQSKIFADIANSGNSDETFDLFLEDAPDGWEAVLGETTVHLPASGAVVKVPVCITPSLTSRAGDYKKIQLTAISVAHPEIRTRNTLVVSVADDTKLEVEPVKRIYRIDPGSSVDVAFRVKNRAEEPMKVGFRSSVINTRSTWLSLDSPATILNAGESRIVTGHLRVPDGEKTGQLIPFAVSAINERGDEIGAVTFEVATCVRHGVNIVINKDGMSRNSGLITTKLVVTNLGTVSDTFVLLIRGGTRRWQSELSVNRVTLPAGESGEATLIVKVPPEIEKRKMISVDVQAKSATNSSASDFVTVNITP